MLEGVIHVDDSSRVVLRGAVVDPGPGAIVSSCDWHAARSSACGVDAAFFDWGTSAGPFDSNSVDRACGSVMVTPWTFDGVDHASSMPPWSISNCDRSIADPRQDITFASENYSSALSVQQSLCAQGPEFASACAIVTTRQACLSGALQIAQAGSSFPISSDVAGIAEFAAGQAAESVAQTAQRSVADNAQTFSSILSLHGALKSLLAVRDAYADCS